LNGSGDGRKEEKIILEIFFGLPIALFGCAVTMMGSFYYQAW